ncbi:aminoglycoside N(3)-acetyltransferase [Sediminibacillus halophilus]|uniref:Aminoglycoside N(3)-acetyltransferase n=1 Tax=Sediminibacillus halophilus TaxID=482461 RepID=A0A1G9NJA6_9BACI|nr:AAC(3) family N-acetyltransferase [Sediminibacillus halophilus]SDL86666.1 aminoglycoside 3-N-acetyltransferase [Sediminibacillus halophilus]
MSEATAVQKIDRPNTRSSLHYQFKELGLKEGMVVIVHSSLRSLGWVCGGPTAVIQALMDSVGKEGTIVMPAQTAENSDPSAWEMPPVPKEWWPVIRDEMPAFDPEYTPTRGMGDIAEAFRSFSGVKRSNHPTYSFTAWGKHAEEIILEQPLTAGFGEGSPLAKIYRLDGFILLLGVGHDSNTSLHLAEHAVPHKKKVEKGTALLEDDKRVWKTYEEIDYDSELFAELGSDYEKTHTVAAAKVGAAEVKLIRQRPMVDYARQWLKNKH